MARVLLVDDDPDVREAKDAYLKLKDHDVTLACDAQDAIGKLKSSGVPFDALVVDMVMKDDGRAGLKVIREALKLDPSNQIIVLTAYGTVKNSVEALKAGAFSYVEKRTDGSENALLLQLIDHADKRRQLRATVEKFLEAHEKLLEQVGHEVDQARRAFEGVRARLKIK